MSEATDLLRKMSMTLDRILEFLEASRPPAAATAGELDSQYGDPIIEKKDPKDWTGDSMQGKRLSQCPPEYLDLWANREDFFAKKADEAQETDNKGRPKSFYNRRDAARARGWAARLRAGWTPPEEPAFGDETPGQNGADPFANNDDLSF